VAQGAAKCFAGKRYRRERLLAEQYFNCMTKHLSTPAKGKKGYRAAWLAHRIGGANPPPPSYMGSHIRFEALP